MAHYYYPRMDSAGPSGSDSSEHQHMDYDEDDLLSQTKPPVRIFIPMVIIGEILGAQGLTLRKICASSGVQIYIHRYENLGASELPASIAGWYPEQCTKACKEILEVMQTEATMTLIGEVSLKLLVRNYLSDGITDMRYLRNIMAQTDTVISTSVTYDIKRQSLDNVIIINGTIENKVRAEALISTKIRNNYKILFSPTERERAKKTLKVVETTYMYVPLAAMITVFGLDGLYLNLNMPSSNNDTKISIAPYRLGDSERIISIVGNPEGQDIAQFLIYQKLLKEGFMRNIMKIDVILNPATVGRIIGRGGRVLGAMRRLTGTVINIPLRHQLVPGQIQTARIIGNYHGIRKAQKRIRLKVEEYLIEQVLLKEKQLAMSHQQ